MKAVLVLLIAASGLAACSECTPGATGNVNVGVGPGGVHTGVSVGKSCGPVNFSIGTGNRYHVAF
ncbi:hypothetical protein [Shimia biformata]|uniref:hypothetical protein n=1 Tax=Shimia biformata TaxID=1294299 RepID=UPI001951EEEF|nr:hypothetical protein [Shimia biformata]